MGVRLTRRAREEPPPGELARVYFDRSATESPAKRGGSAGMHRLSNAAWVLPQAARRSAAWSVEDVPNPATSRVRKSGLAPTSRQTMPVSGRCSPTGRGLALAGSLKLPAWRGGRGVRPWGGCRAPTGVGRGCGTDVGIACRDRRWFRAPARCRPEVGVPSRPRASSLSATCGFAALSGRGAGQFSRGGLKTGVPYPVVQ